MADINPKDVMNLRNKTGLPMMDCKQALADVEIQALIAAGGLDECRQAQRRQRQQQRDHPARNRRCRSGRRARHALETLEL